MMVKNDEATTMIAGEPFDEETRKLRIYRDEEGNRVFLGERPYIEEESSLVFPGVNQVK